MNFSINIQFNMGDFGGNSILFFNKRSTDFSVILCFSSCLSKFVQIDFYILRFIFLPSQSIIKQDMQLI